jgi:hypothetical protein
MATGGIDTASEYRACGTFRWQFRTYATSSGGRLKVARMAGIGPLLPSAASAGRGSYVGISCRRRERRAMAEDDPHRNPDCASQQLRQFDLSKT